MGAHATPNWCSLKQPVHTEPLKLLVARQVFIIHKALSQHVPLVSLCKTHFRSCFIVCVLYFCNKIKILKPLMRLLWPEWSKKDLKLDAEESPLMNMFVI